MNLVKFKVRIVSTSLVLSLCITSFVFSAGGGGGTVGKPGNSWKDGGGAVFSGGLVAPDVVIPNPSTTTDLLSATTSTDLAKQPKANAHKPLISSKRFAHRKAVPPANL